ncbi:hypothetical protein [Rhizobium ruizarguesonis]|uniref:hypothetical protein n=1 Tax=Rhizobium ruizarguesonis TaxID=2081791 RepID=UPI00102F615F|nr:hypothetical protein [Rhizobium ruizarguesonis]TBD80711.1 hypothetical protein ELH11_12805 [Rhizobium ruizarguesonis]TBE11872.1 hypothetical protein ELH09_12880 [Rhizobium ruizarguesonis]TBE23755.1 hypothetical protein ELH08_13110 [Rhizobium ruizarguesonis]TBE33596.1 hypothetical protein ELH07_13580 [Rhizobium ruizarguesonis]WSG99984.1 hypothetical protein U8P71_15315 [Rhizobium ruizarguesonis]
MTGLGDKIADKAIDYAVGAGIWIVGSVLPGLLGSQQLQDPFYHEGWLQDNKAWVPLFVIIWFLSLCAVLRVAGLVLVTLVVLVSASVFAIYYAGSSGLSDNQQLALWVVHAILYSAIPGAAAGWIITALKWAGAL